MGSRPPRRSTSGYHLAFLIGAGLVVAAIVVIVTVLRAPAAVDAEAELEFEPAYAEAA